MRSTFSNSGFALAGPVDGQRFAELKGVRVLIVESDPTSAGLQSALLADGGCDVRAVRTAEEALAILGVFSPRAVLLDLILPRMSGLLLAQQLKGTRSTRDTLLVALASFNGSRERRVALEAGCSAYVSKPIDPEALTRLLANLISPKGKREP